MKRRLNGERKISLATLDWISSAKHTQSFSYWVRDEINFIEDNKIEEEKGGLDPKHAANSLTRVWLYYQFSVRFIDEDRCGVAMMEASRRVSERSTAVRPITVGKIG